MDCSATCELSRADVGGLLTGIPPMNGFAISRADSGGALMGIPLGIEPVEDPELLEGGDAAGELDMALA